MSVDNLILIMSIIGLFGILFIFEKILSIFTTGSMFGYVISCFIRDYKAAQDSEDNKYRLMTYAKIWFKQYLSVTSVKARNCKSCDFTVCPYFESLPLEKKPENKKTIFKDGLSFKDFAIDTLKLLFEFSMLALSGSLLYYLASSMIQVNSLKLALLVPLVVIIPIFLLIIIVNLIVYLCDKHCKKSNAREK